VAVMFIVFDLYIFFFQVEDGIRDFHVTGVQTCALPIYGDGLGGRLRPCACERARPRKGGDRVNACAEAARILIADDDDDARRLLVKYLTEKGFHVTTAEDGSEACRRVFADEPDLVLDRKCDE